jgi:hypothetical protein
VDFITCLRPDLSTPLRVCNTTDGMKKEIDRLLNVGSLS